MEEIDLSGFPVIRLDQIPFVDSPTLLKACDEVAELMASFSSDGKRPPLVFYLQKQTQAMCQELAGRAAKQRMDSILNGAASPKRKESAPIASAMNNSDQQSTTTVNTEDLVSDFSNSKKAISFKPLPLPSELRRASEALNDQSKGEQNFSDSEGSSFKSSSSAPASAYSGTKIDIARARASNLAKSGELHSNGRIITSRSVDGVDEDSSDSGTQVSETTAKSNTTKPRRPRSSAETAPKKTSMDVINENFGNSFIVAPNEKKRRFYPKKKTESVESIKAKEKLDRYVTM